MTSSSKPRRFGRSAAALCGVVALATLTTAAPVLAKHATPKTRYEMANQCWAIQSAATGKYLTSSSDGYAASAADTDGAERFYLKPTALGKYMLFGSDRLLVNAGAGGLDAVPTPEATDSVEWQVKVIGDATIYPATPEYHVEPSAQYVREYLAFRDNDPNIKGTEFSLEPVTMEGQQLFASDTGDVDLSAAANNPGFRFVETDGCAHFPEAESNFSGEPFKGTTKGGKVLGHTDAHVHISATEFLGGVEHGRPYHKFGIEHALSDCKESHGEHGFQDVVGGLFATDTDGHETAGFPEFTAWPARDMLTHEAIYWKWLERAWASGLRVIVNDLVDNETLCELQREIAGDPTQDCNSMNNAGRQAGTMYGMMDYIDAQYGGRGKGFFQIVHDSRQAREVIEKGKAAVILGVEISNLFDCKVNYNPARTQRPFEETGEGGTENSYGCTEQSLVAQMDRAWGWGVRQLITIHEFDNAFGGNGIFDGLILNLGNKENSGLIPSGDLAKAWNYLAGGGDPAQLPSLVASAIATEKPTGEWWTTYDCPEEGQSYDADGDGNVVEFSGYLWGSAGGSSQSWLSAPFCAPMGQEGRFGGLTPCYPKGPVTDEFENGGGFRFSDYPPFDQTPNGKARQCNARWMTPIGLYAYKKIMERGFIFDWDHLEMGMKTQLLDLAEAQDIPYPLVSTHGTFGGTTIDQAARVLKSGGVLYPSNGSSRGFRNDMTETYGIFEQATAELPNKEKPLFGFGYGTDTNGLSAQTGPRNANDKNYQPFKPLEYPYSLFEGGPWANLSEFAKVEPVRFEQPSSTDAEGNEVRTWHQDVDGHAHQGMISDFVQEIALEGTPEELQHLFYSAEVYLQMWAKTEASSKAINGQAKGDPEKILRKAPGGSDPGEYVK